MVSGLLQGDAGEITAKFGLVMGLTAEAACRSALSRASSGEGAEAEPLAACSQLLFVFGHRHPKYFCKTACRLNRRRKSPSEHWRSRSRSRSLLKELPEADKLKVQWFS